MENIEALSNAIDELIQNTEVHISQLNALEKTAEKLAYDWEQIRISWNTMKEEASVHNEEVQQFIQLYHELEDLKEIVRRELGASSISEEKQLPVFIGYIKDNVETLKPNQKILSSARKIKACAVKYRIENHIRNKKKNRSRQMKSTF